MKTKTDSATRRAGILVVATLFAVGLFTGCETTSHGQQGQVIGAVVGGVVGAQVGDGHGRTAAIILGSLAGSMIGQHIGESMDETDRMLAARTLNDYRTGESRSWVNPDTGYEYVVTPTNTYDAGTGPCREYTLDATIGGKTEQIYGTACRQADGSWLVVD